jgi:hypothetical protein
MLYMYGNDPWSGSLPCIKQPGKINKFYLFIYLSSFSSDTEWITGKKLLNKAPYKYTRKFLPVLFETKTGKEDILLGTQVLSST